MSNIRKNVYLNTVHRLNSATTSASNCEMNLPFHFDGVEYLQLNQVALYNLFYPFSSYSNQIKINVNDASEYTISLPTDKTFTPSEMISELTTLINAESAGLLNASGGITYDSQTGKLTFNWNTDTEFQAVENSAYYKLGLTNNLDGGIESQTVGGNVAQWNSKQIYLSFPNIASGQSSNTNASLSSAFCMIPLNYSFGGMIVYEPPTPILIKLNSHSVIQNIKLLVTNANGKIKEFDGNIALSLSVV